MLAPKYMPVIIALALCCGDAVVPQPDATPDSQTPPMMGELGASCDVDLECDSKKCLTKYRNDVPIATPGWCTQYCFPQLEEEGYPQCPDEGFECLGYFPTGEQWCYVSCDTEADCFPDAECYLLSTGKRICLPESYLERLREESEEDD